MKAFVIYQNTVPMSVNFAKEAEAAGKKHGFDVRGWIGTNGLTETYKFSEYGLTTFLADSITKLPGLQGCFLSHYELWQKSVAMNETVLILEHDGIFIRDLPKNFEDQFTEILNLDPYDQFTDGYHEKVESSLSTPVKIENLHSSKRDKAGPYIPGAYGYFVKPAGAQKLIDFAKNKGMLPTDKHIGTDIVDIKITNVPVVKLHNFYNRKNVKKFSMTKSLEKFINV